VAGLKMIQSMTAFARVQAEGQWGSAVCELRSINHRYLEIMVRLPDNLHELEMAMRECLREQIKRGKVECYIRYQPGNTTGSEITINTHLAQQLCQANEAVAQLLRNPAPINPVEILKWPGILQIAEIDLEAIEDELEKLLKKAVQELIAARAREGEELKQLFLQRLEAMKTEIAKVRQRMPEILKLQRERLSKRFADLKLDIDNVRLEQEMVLFVQRTDVAEELDRLDTHISEVRRVLKQGGVVGRRLDFLMQELNREANTLGSKSVDTDSTRASVELKVLIEQMREQVQNLE
jgi:uncharacterized protein (TIGR00255 family)